MNRSINNHLLELEAIIQYFTANEIMSIIAFNINKLRRKGIVSGPVFDDLGTESRFLTNYLNNIASAR